MTTIMVDFVFAFLLIGVLSFAVGMVLDLLPHEDVFMHEFTNSRVAADPRVFVNEQTSAVMKRAA